MNAHLTDQELSQLLEQPEGAATSQHLASCDHCTAELEAMRSSLLSFRQTATRMAETLRPEHVMLPGSVRRTIPIPRFFSSRNAWATGLATALALGTLSLSLVHGTPHGTHRAAVVAADQRSGATARSANSGASAADDALLEGIDADLSTAVPPSLQPLDTAAASESTSTTKD